MKKFHIVITVLLLCAAIVMLSLTARTCSETGGGFIEVFRIIKEPQMTVTGSSPCELPEIYDVPWANEANAVISSALAPLTAAVADADAESEVVHTSYIFTAVDGGYEIGVYAAGSGTVTGSMHITDISLDRSGKVNVQEYTVPEFMHDGDFLRGAFALSSLGLSIPEYDECPAFPEICEMLIRYYEAYTGSTIDTSVLRWESDDEIFKKSVVMGFCDNDYDYYRNYDNAFVTDFARMAEDVFSKLYVEHFGRSSTAVSYREFSDALSLFFDIFFGDNITRGDIQAIVSSSDVTLLSSPSAMTRADAAVIFNQIYTAAFRELRSPGESPFEDELSYDSRVAYEMSFMGPFPSQRLFSEDYVLRGCQLADTVRWFTDTCYWNSIVFDMMSVTEDRTVWNKDVVSAIGLLNDYMASYQKPAQSEVVVSNSPSYNWYFSQFDTGSYSAINCMPSMSAMALKWYDPQSTVSVEDLRNMYLEENDGGWYMSEVIDSIDYFNIPFTEFDMDENFIENIMAQLDAGRIILTQMSEAPDAESGHCFVIYGYRKLGDSVRFMLHDSCIYDGTDEFGKRPGEDMVLDGEYVRWIIERIAYNYVAVGD